MNRKDQIRSNAKRPLRRRARNILLGAAWGWILPLGRLPAEVPIELVEIIMLFPLFIASIATNAERRKELKRDWKAWKRHYYNERVKNNSLLERYETGDLANCDCVGCRLGRKNLRKWLEKHYLKAYCVRCKKKVTIKDPQKVIFKNGSEAISGECHICGGRVLRIGKFYGSGLYEESNLSSSG